MQTLCYQQKMMIRLTLWLVLLLFFPKTVWATDKASVPNVTQWQEVRSGNHLPQATLVTNSTHKTESSFETELVPTFPEQQWWSTFQDPYLNAYIAEAVRHNPNVQASVHRITQARAVVMENFARQLPSLSLAPGFNRIGLPDLAGGAFPSALRVFMLAFQPSFELDLFGKNHNMTQSSKKELAATELDAKTMLLTVQGEVATAYFNLLRADSLVVLQEENLTLLKQIEALKRSLQGAGLTSYDEVFRADRDVAMAMTSLAMYRQQQALFAHQLAFLLGRPPVSEGQLERSRISDLKLPSQTQVGLPSELVARRPDILARERRLERATIDVKVARKAFLPSVNLSGTFAWAGGGFEDAFFQSKNFADVESVGIHQPLFQGGRLVGGLKRQKAREKELIEMYRGTILTALKEVEDQLALLNSNYDTLNSNTKRQELTENTFRLTQNQYEHGLVPRLNVLQSQSEVLQYRQLSVQSKADAMIATVNLYKSLGGGF